jgi:chaperonin cofactor prefoldin
MSLFSFDSSWSSAGARVPKSALTRVSIEGGPISLPVPSSSSSDLKRPMPSSSSSDTKRPVPAPGPSDLKRLERAARIASVRLRVDEAVRRGALWLVGPMLYAVAALTVIKVWQPPPHVEAWLVGGVALPAAVVLAVVLHALFRPRPWFAGALALDRHHGLSDRITNALAFASEGERTPLMDAAIEDAARSVPKLSPRRAAPIRFPKDLAISLGLGAAVVGIAQLEVRTTRFVPEPARTFEALVVSPDDLEVFREMAREVRPSDDPKLQESVRRFNQLVEDLAEKRLDRQEAFRRLEELESGLLEAVDADQEAVEEALRQMGAALAKSRAGEDAGKAMQENRLPDAEEAMKKLAERLESREKIDKKRLEELRRALEAASKTTTEKLGALEQERQELEERRKRLLKKKEEQGLSKQEENELRKTERRLERLEREKQRQQNAKKELDDLDRDLAKAAEELMKQLGEEAAKHLRQGAQELNRSAQQQMSRQQKQELKKRLEQMREMLRQQGQGGAKRQQQLVQFGQRARGGKPMPGEGQEGEGQPGQGQQGQGQGKDGQGKPGRGGQPILSLKPGQGGGQGPTVLMPGAGGIPLPGEGGGREGPGGGSGPGGEQWGTGHDPNVKGDATSLRGETQDVAAAAQDTGQGASASQVIYGAAERGFVGKGYRQVFTEYETVAEEVLAKDEIPPGYEFYVRRYFQLIRPRE